MTKLREIFTRAVHQCSLLFPRSQNIWAFIGWHRGHGVEIFADNTKYLFLHIANNRKDITPVWIAKDRTIAKTLRLHGYRSYYEKSLLGIWYALRAGTTAIDAYLQPVNYQWSGNTRLVQLLHGKGMKKGGYTQKPMQQQDIIFSPSQFVNDMLSTVFVQKSPMIISGYPRNDIFFRKIHGSSIGINETERFVLEDTRYDKRLLYAPTFRRGQKTLDLEKILDLERLSTWLREHSFLLVIRLHSKYHAQTRSLSYPNILFSEDSDVYPILHHFDVLINDYSSLFTDFLLLDRPIVFYPYDLEDYKEKEGLSFDYASYTPGPKAYSYEELIHTLKEVLDEDNHKTERKHIRDLYHKYQDGHSSERILEALEMSDCEPRH